MSNLRHRIHMAFRVLTGKSIAFDPIVDDWPYDDNELPGMWENADFIDNSEKLVEVSDPHNDNGRLRAIEEWDDECADDFGL